MTALPTNPDTPRSHSLSFGDIIRSLLVRIRAYEKSRSHKHWPPTARTGASLYRVIPTAWGVESAEKRREDEATPPSASASVRPAPDRRRGLRIPVFRLPVPRGLPAT